MSEILIEGNGKFPMDVRVPIVSVQCATDGAAKITAQGTYRGRPVGIEIEIQGQMRPGIVDDDFDTTAVYENGIVIRAIGDSTQRLADVFSEVYIIPVKDAEPLYELDLTCIALDGDPALIETEHLNFKVFHDDEDKRGQYFEMFLHIDIPLAYVRLNEKDEDYRENVVKSFAALLPVPV
jgi:hypothetical protein